MPGRLGDELDHGIRTLTPKPPHHRLELIPATLEICEAESRGSEAVALALRVRVPASWPPPVLEPDDVERLRRKLESDPSAHGWTLHYLVLRETTGDGRRDLVGVAGYAGPPSSDGAVEIGYAIAEEYQRRGYATEAVQALIERAFAEPSVVVVTATTYASLAPSIGVLMKSGFSLVSSDPETGLVKYECRRERAS
jgi:ribosomal-protein-alanine N-acetyltransferase